MFCYLFFYLYSYVTREGLSTALDIYDRLGDKWNIKTRETYKLQSVKFVYIKGNVLTSQKNIAILILISNGELLANSFVSDFIYIVLEIVVVI